MAAHTRQSRMCPISSTIRQYGTGVTYLFDCSAKQGGFNSHGPPDAQVGARGPAPGSGPHPHPPASPAGAVGGGAPVTPIATSKKSDSLCKLYDMDENPDRRGWLDKLLAFMDERRTPITACPTISKQPLDLYKLYVLVKERGGFVEVCKVP